MKYSYNWLKELSGSKKSVIDLAQEITMRAFEVEEIEKVGKDFAGVVVGNILEIKKHPNADKLQIVMVETQNVASVPQTLQIVCGAHNISVGDHVPVATVGTDLGEGFIIKEAEIRGVKSFGMLCALDELGLGTDHSGILLLDKKTEIGTPFANVIGGKDEAIEIKILPDRAHDALSHVGMAREIAALEGKTMEYAYNEIELPKKKTQKLGVKIEDSKICSRYIGAVLENVKITESPSWLKQRLEVCGIRPINNVVDVTNYIMLELGQPLHAFDFDIISNQQIAKIIVRKAKKGEKITLLDGSVKELIADDIVIARLDSQDDLLARFDSIESRRVDARRANEKHALALAGVMGGEDSGINENTKNIVLEAANFEAVSIRKTRTRLNILTDAAYRFEKEIDPNVAEKAMMRAIEILEHIADAKLEGIADEYPKPKKPWTIALDLDYVDKLLGEKIPAQAVKKILTSLGFGIKGSGKKLTVTVPTFRIDATTQEDLIEEIGRIYGYDKVKPSAPLVQVKSPVINEKRAFGRQLKNILVAQGFNEVYNYSFYSQKDAGLAELGAIKHLELQNPANPDQALMRVSLIPNMLKNIAENLKNFREFHLFEIGRTYHVNDGALPEEKTILVGAVMLEKKSAKQQAQDKRHESSFYELKSHVDQMMERIGIDDYYFDTFNGSPLETPLSLWHQSRSAEIKIENHEKAVGYMGEINPLVLSQFGIGTRVAMFEFDVDRLNEIAEQEREYTPIRKYPIVTRDISMIAQQDVRVDDILQTIQEAGGNLVLDVDLFDAIDFADNSTSFAFHIQLGADDRTLTGKEIDDTMNKIIESLEKQSGVKVRK